MAPPSRSDIGVLISALSIAVLALYFLSELSITPDNRVFYHDKNPRYVELVEVENTFELYSNVTFLIASDAPLSPDTAQAITWLSIEVESYQGYVRHSSLSNYPHLEEQEDNITITSVLEAACPLALHCDDIVDRENYPEIKQVENRLLSPDATAFAVTVAVDIGVSDISALQKLTHQIQETISSFNENYPHLNIVHTGAIPMMQAFADASNQDLGKLFPISILLIGFVSAVLFGSIRFALIALVCAILNVVWVMGLASLFKLQINSATSTLPLALLVISISSSAHLICYISLRMSERRRDRNAFRDLVTQATIANRTPILMASLTTCIGLATLSFVEIPPFREFGLLAALGTITNYFVVVGVLPAALRNIPPGKEKLRTSIFLRLINRYARYIDNGRLPIKTVLLATCAAATGLMNFSIDEDYVKYFDKSHEFRIGADLLTDKLASPYSMDIAINFGEPGAALDRVNLDALTEFQQQLESDELVVNVLSLVQHLELAKLAFGEPENANDAEYVEQLYLAYELSLPPGHSTNVLIDPNHQILRVSVLLGEASSSTIIAFENRIKEYWQEAPAELSHGTVMTVTGETLPLAHLSEESIRTVLFSISVCLILLWLGIALSTKSILLAFISVGAALGPLAFAFGSWAWVDSEFGLATAIVIAVTIGIIVDDTIHFLFRYSAGKRNHDLAANAAITYAIHHSAAGIISSSLILVSGFLILCLSSFAVNQQFGIGVSLTIASALLLTLIALPAVLITLRPRLN